MDQNSIAISLSEAHLKYFGIDDLPRLIVFYENNKNFFRSQHIDFPEFLKLIKKLQKFPEDFKKLYECKNPAEVEVELNKWIQDYFISKFWEKNQEWISSLFQGKRELFSHSITQSGIAISRLYRDTVTLQCALKKLHLYNHLFSKTFFYYHQYQRTFVQNGLSLYALFFLLKYNCAGISRFFNATDKAACIPTLQSIRHKKTIETLRKAKLPLETLNLIFFYVIDLFAKGVAETRYILKRESQLPHRITLSPCGSVVVNLRRSKKILLSNSVEKVYRAVLFQEFRAEIQAYTVFDPIKHERENNALKQLKHPNIPPYWIEHGIAPVTVSYVSKKDKRQKTKTLCLQDKYKMNWLKAAANTNINFSTKLKWVRDAFMGLEYMHANNVYHCNIQANIIMIDKRNKTVLTNFSSVIWLPEPVNEISRADDIYALALSSYFLLFNKSPPTYVPRLIPSLNGLKLEPHEVAHLEKEAESRIDRSAFFQESRKPSQDHIALCHILKDCFKLHPKNIPSAKTIVEKLTTTWKLFPVKT